MGIAEMAKVLGRAGRWEPTTPEGGLSVDVRIVDVRQAYGKLQYRIVPLSGTGEVWVSAANVSVRDSGSLES